MRIVNRQAYHNYHIIDTLEAGIKLRGMEVKSIRSGRVDLSESFARIQNGEAVLINAHIPCYQNAPAKDYDPGGTRKLLLHKSQIQFLIGKISSGMVLIPLSIHESHNLIKVQLGLGRSKKQFDKRRAIKERDQQRRIEQELRGKE